MNIYEIHALEISLPRRFLCLGDFFCLGDLFGLDFFTQGDLFLFRGCLFGFITLSMLLVYFFCVLLSGSDKHCL